MIDARELRIGNIVGVKDNRNDYFREKYEVIDIFGTSGLFTLKELGSEYVKHRYPGVYLRPISLSPEILEKVGFTKSEDVCERFTAPYYKSWKNYIHIALVNDKFRLWIECEDEYYNWYWTEIPYIHTLQNLVFALRGEDLNVDGLI